MLHAFREDLLAQQARVERLATFGQVVGSIGHELRNPLGVMESSLFILKGRLGDDERAHKHADRIGDQLGVANRIITHLLELIRDRPLVVEPVVLQGLLDDAAQALVGRRTCRSPRRAWAASRPCPATRASFARSSSTSWRTRSSR